MQDSGYIYLVLEKCQLKSSLRAETNSYFCLLLKFTDIYISPANLIAMDPLSIVASTIALAQVADRILTLATKIRRYLNAPAEINALITDISDLRLVLGKLHSNTPIFPVQELPTLRKLLNSCNSIMVRIEEMINEIYLKSGKPDSCLEPRFRRLIWLKNKREIDRLSRQLSDSKTLLTLQLVGVNV